VKASVSAQAQLRLKVLYVLPGSPAGHNMIFARSSARALREVGVDVDEFYIESRTDFRKLGATYKRLSNEISVGSYDLVHAQYGGVTGLTVAQATNGRIPMVLTIRGSDLNRVPSAHLVKNYLTIAMTRTAVRRSRRVICVSRTLAQKLRTQDPRISVIPSGVDTSVFFPVEQTQARFQLGWPPGKRVVLFNAGRSPVQKGLPLVKATIDVIKTRGLDPELYILNGEHQPKDVALLMNASDCLLLASETEGSPNVVKEAMACNLPVVSVKVGDVEQRLKGVSPSAVVERSAAAMAAAAISVLASATRSNGSAVIAEQGLSLEIIARKLRAVYEEVVRETRVTHIQSS